MFSYIYKTPKYTSLPTIMPMVLSDILLMVAIYSVKAAPTYKDVVAKLPGNFFTSIQGGIQHFKQGFLKTKKDSRWLRKCM